MSHPRVESDMMLPFESMETIEEEEEDIDPFKELEVATSAPSIRGANALAELEGSDPLSAFEDDEDSGGGHIPAEVFDQEEFRLHMEYVLVLHRNVDNMCLL